jgi:hypothetical protein
METLEKRGAFSESLRRNNSQIRKDRADAISEDTEIIYKRKIEDLVLKIKKMNREQENMLDLSPSDKNTIISVGDFDTEMYVNSDITLGVNIRNEEIRLNIAVKRFEYLFGYSPVVRSSEATAE